MSADGCEFRRSNHGPGTARGGGRSAHDVPIDEMVGESLARVLPESARAGHGRLMPSRTLTLPRAYW